MKSKVKKQKAKVRTVVGVLFLLFTIHCSLFTVYSQSGGTFDLSRSVIASGGEFSTGGTINVNGTIGQNIAGTTSTGGSFAIRGGFWFENLVPTAASVSISGQVTASTGNGIGNTLLTLENVSTGERMIALTNAFGHYRFDQVLVGQTYLLIASSKRFLFNPSSQIISLTDEISGVNFTALPEE